MTKRRSKDLNTGLWKSDFEKIFSKSLLSMEWELTHYTLPRQKNNQGKLEHIEDNGFIF